MGDARFILAICLGLFAIPHAKADDARGDAALRAYLAREYPCEVTRVVVEEMSVRIEGTLVAEARPSFLAELPIPVDAFDVTEFPFVAPIAATGDRFEMTVDRYRVAGADQQDRLLSRWAIVRKAGNGFELQSHARWPDAVQSKWSTPQVKPRSKKGLGGFHSGRLDSDLDDLGIAAVTVNVNLNGIFRCAPGEGRTAFEYGGRTWYADDRAVSRLDTTMEAAARREIVVSAIVLISPVARSPDKEWAKLVCHPDADPSGTYVMPNVGSADGVRAYAAALDFLARRYGGPRGQAKHGRIHHWIMHNEVDAGWVWTNAGIKTAPRYMDLYQKSMRMAHLIARQYDPHAKAFISLTHHWARTTERHSYPSRDLLELLLDFSKAEGDFDWAIAHHPYPQDLFNPRVWENDQATGSFDTPKITFKNIEVLDAWVNRPRAMFLGKHRRTIHLSEQGLNSRDYSAKSSREQAAGMAYAWNKVKGLDSIEAFQYHNWIDNRGEGGLRIGLRRFADDEDDPLGKKPIWDVYRALGTADEAAATEFAKSIVGVRDWSEITTSVRR
jgi:hypothetical protein